MVDNRVCIKCDKVKDLSEFYTMKRMTLGVDSKCKPCAHKDQRERRKVKWDDLFKYKGSACEHCGVSKPEHPEIYDFHHKNPEDKENHVADLIMLSKERLHLEVDKCLMLCSNCHKMEHARLRKETLNE